MIRRLAFWFRWWKWFVWDCPSTVRLVMAGLDADSRKIIYERHERKEPKQ